MSTFAVQNQFVFIKEQEGIYSFLTKLVSFIEQNLPETDGKARVVSQSKLIITELVTNVIKHCGGNAVFEIALSEDLLYIKKTDSGTPFYLKEKPDRPAMSWPLNIPAPGRINIYSDDLNGLFGEILNERELRFYTEEYTSSNSTITDMSEHFGLMIISKLAHDFRYIFDDASQLNTFIITLRL